MHEEPGITFRSVKSSAPKSAWGNNARTEEERLQTIWLIPAPWLEEKRWYPSNIHKGTQFRHTRRNPGAHGGGKKKSTCRGKCLSDPSTARTEGQQGETAEHRGAARADATPLLGRVGQGAKEHQTRSVQGPARLNPSTVSKARRRYVSVSSVLSSGLWTGEQEGLDGVNEHQRAGRARGLEHREHPRHGQASTARNRSRRGAHPLPPRPAPQRVRRSSHLLGPPSASRVWPVQRPGVKSGGPARGERGPLRSTVGL